MAGGDPGANREENNGSEHDHQGEPEDVQDVQKAEKAAVQRVAGDLAVHGKSK